MKDNSISKLKDYFGHFDYIDRFVDAQMVLQNRRVSVSHYLDFNKWQVKTPLSDDGIPRYAMNHPYDLLNAIRCNDNNVYLNEALLASWSIDATIQHFRKTSNKIVPQKLRNITFAELYDNSSNSGKILDYYKLNEMNEGLVSFIFPFPLSLRDESIDNKKNIYSRLSEGSQEIAKKLVDAMYVTGYFLSFAENLKITKKMMKLGIGLCALQFESRYSRKVANLSKYLYHVSPIRYFNKISKNGIIPQSKSENLSYPNRVYLFNNTCFELIKPFGVVKSMQLLQKKCKWVDDNTFVVFAISTDKLLNHHLYKNGKMVFYIDPCYNGKIGGIDICEAVYTYSHIPLSLIENKCFVYRIAKDEKNKTQIKFDHLQMFPS